MTIEAIVLIVGLSLLVLSAIAAICGHVSQRNARQARLRAAAASIEQHSAPDEMRPAMVGALDDGNASESDLLVSLIDLAARGYLTLTPLRDEPDEDPYDWQIKRTTRPTAGLTDFEKVLVTRPFDDRADSGRSPTVTLSSLTKDESHALQAAKTKLVEQLTDLGWLAEHERKSTRWGWIGGLVAVIGLLVSAWMIIAWLTDDDVTGIIGGLAIVGAGLLLASVGRTKTHSQEADGVVRQLASYRDYLVNELPAKLSADNLNAAFNQHLPWSMQLGVADKFAAAVDDFGRRAEGWGTGKTVNPQWLVDSREHNSATEIGELLDSFVSAARNEVPKR